MIGVTKVIHYICEECGSDYDTAIEAKNCYDACCKGGDDE